MPADLRLGVGNFGYYGQGWTKVGWSGWVRLILVGGWTYASRSRGVCSWVLESLSW